MTTDISDAAQHLADLERQLRDDPDSVSADELLQARAAADHAVLVAEGRANQAKRAARERHNRDLEAFCEAALNEGAEVRRSLIATIQAAGDALALVIEQINTINSDVRARCLALNALAAKGPLPDNVFTYSMRHWTSPNRCDELHIRGRRVHGFDPEQIVDALAASALHSGGVRSERVVNIARTSDAVLATIDQ